MTRSNKHLTARRHQLLARLAAERAQLLWQLLGLNRELLILTPIFPDSDWTVKDLLAHLAAWDRWEHRTMATMVAGEEPDLAAVEDMDAFNAAAVDAGRDRTLSETLAELQAAREAWVAWLRDVPLEPFFASREHQSWDWAFPGCLLVQWQHDAEHADQLAAWRTDIADESDTGPKSVLFAVLKAARDELLATVDLIPPTDRTSRPVCGYWTLKDVVGHVADWEQVGVEGLHDMAAGCSPSVAPIPDIEAWNQEHAAARENQPWETCWEDLHRTRDQLLDVLRGMDQQRIDQSYRFPWGPEGTAYEWVRVFGTHDREHAHDLRRAASRKRRGTEED